MLTYFSVEGFKNFGSKLSFDLTNTGKYLFNSDQIRKGLINKGIIYGKNGEGKSNLGQALFDIEGNIAYSVTTLNNQLLLRSPQTGIYKTLGRKGDVNFEYRFLFDNNHVIYLYSKKEPNFITREKLIINDETLIDYSLGKEVTCNIPEAKNIIFSNMASGNSPLFFLFNFLKFNNSNPLSQMYEFIRGMLWFRCLNQGNEAYGFPARFDIIEDAIIRENKVQDFQNFLRSFGLEYNLEATQLTQFNGLTPQTKRVLVARFGKQLAPLSSLLSTGSTALELFYYWSLRFSQVTFLFIDEFDAFYHYELSASIVKILNQCNSFQSFLTTHNTSLMNTRLMRPDTLFLLSKNTIKPLCDCTEGELREGHNLEKIYREGGFDE